MLEVQIEERKAAAGKLREAREAVMKDLEGVGVVLGDWLKKKRGEGEKKGDVEMGERGESVMDVLRASEDGRPGSN